MIYCSKLERRLKSFCLKAHEAAVDFITFLFCVNKHLKYHYTYYKSICVPWGAGQIDFQDFMDFVSPETRKTSKSA